MNEKKLFLAEGLQKKRRLVNWWMSWEDLNWPSSDGKDRIERRAEALAEAGVTTAVLFGCHFRWDYLPYFTLLHDHIAAIAEALHKRDIELFDRHSVNLVHRYDTREEMRHVMLHSGPHLPFSPSREAAASWEYKGKLLNDWRMIDVRSRTPLYYPQYASEGFCYRNPDFLEAYCDYAKHLVADTGIDGLAAEDPVHYMHYISCACPHCRAELKRRTGQDLPAAADRNFWGNWENPAWRAWIDLRYDAGKEFFEKLMGHLPAHFPVTTCGANSAAPTSNGKASDARAFLQGGSNYAHAEWSGNTPPYKHDPVTVNTPLIYHMVGASHHQAAAKERGLRCFTTGYGFTEPSANIIWALNKTMDMDCCFSTLKARLGLPQSVLNTLPTEADVIGAAYRFERDHARLFAGEQIGQMGVYFSYETRNHTCFGNMNKGYYKDFSAALGLLFAKGISAHTVFDFPQNAEEYPLILVPSPAAMTDAERTALDGYLAAGGRVIVCGPADLADCKHTWALPTAPTLESPDKFFSTIANGVWHKAADWITKTELAPSADPDAWQTPRAGLWYTPHRLSDGAIDHAVAALCKEYAKPLPVAVTAAEGYLTTAFEDEQGITVHLLAEDYDTDIDHHLDEIRFHRSRVNYVNKVEPIGIADAVRLVADQPPAVYTPFNAGETVITKTEAGYTLRFPEKTAYAILRFAKGQERE